jgi:tRNA-splicing ligase RtcB
MARPDTLKRIGWARYELPMDFRPGMRVPVRVYGTDKLVAEMDDQVFVQAANVATLPGIVDASICMPDAHWGYGFPIGGVAAVDVRSGVISPGGIGFDINCGMRLVRTDLEWPQVKPHLRQLVDRLAERVPAGVGRRGFVRPGPSEFAEVLREGAGWAVREGYGTPEDLAFTESHGCFADADPECVSDRAVKRGMNQLGTLGSGNHYLEIQVLRPENVFDAELASRFGLSMPEQVVVMFHCGSRGFGHQVASDYLQSFLAAMPGKFGLEVIDRELACAPIRCIGFARSSATSSAGIRSRWAFAPCTTSPTTPRASSGSPRHAVRASSSSTARVRPGRCPRAIPISPPPTGRRGSP